MHVPTFLVGICIAGIGVLLTYLFIRAGNACTERTTGTVTGHRKVKAGNTSRSYFYYENVAYMAEGVEYLHKRKAGFPTPQYPEGEQLVLLYNPGKPNTSRLEADKKDKPLLGPFTVLAGIGIMVLSFFIL
ncbi:MAG: DUF3592 domain-containing protein [Firmicutes bacterium]|nr:DUF3592 domain-containing protein [Bacillota bacterium]